MKTFLGEVTLQRRTYRVYDTANGYTCESTNKQGDGKVHELPVEVIEHAASVLAGTQWAVKDAELALQAAATRDRWKYTYGHQYHYMVQDVLVVMVATGRATVEKDGKKFVYDVRGDR